MSRTSLPAVKQAGVIPVLPRDFDEGTKDLSDDERKALKAEAQRRFVKAKAEWVRLVRKDRTPGLTRTAKLIAIYLIDCLNFETGRCFPSYEVIADELGISEKTVSRSMKSIVAAGWVSLRRARRNLPTFYFFHAPEEKVKRILDMDDALRESREARREDRRYPVIEHEATPASTAQPDTNVRSATIRADIGVQSDRTLTGGEHKKRTPEEDSGTDIEGYTLRARTRETDPSNANAYARAKGGL